MIASADGPLAMTSLMESVISMIAGSQPEYVILSKGPDLIDFNQCEWTPEDINSARRHLERYYYVLREFADVGEHRNAIVVHQRRADGTV